MLDLSLFQQLDGSQAQTRDAAVRAARCSASSSTSVVRAETCCTLSPTEAGVVLPAADGADHPRRAEGGAVISDRFGSRWLVAGVQLLLAACLLALLCG
jgi:hypothetical protein